VSVEEGPDRDLVVNAERGIGIVGNLEDQDLLLIMLVLGMTTD
jgi:hypothetical protein